MVRHAAAGVLWTSASNPRERPPRPPVPRRGRRRCPRRRRRRAVRRGRARAGGRPEGGRGARPRHGAALRHLHRLRRAGHPAHPGRAARPAAALAGALARRGHRARGGARGRACAACSCGCRRWPPAAPACASRPPSVYAAMLNAGITPVVHEYGSLGCSGDLAPLAACALAAMGEGMVRDARRRAVPAAEALAAAGITPVVLAEKEGLALINGTDGMLGMLVLAAHDLRAACVRTADVAAAMSVEALLGTDAVFAADLQALRPHPGQAAQRGQPARPPARARRSWPATATRSAPACRTPTRCAARRRCTAPSATPSRTPRRWPRRELAAAIDNPVVLPDGRVESNGNFHGAPLGYVLDFLAIAVADLASISERRTDRFLDVARSARAAAVPRRRPGRRLRAHDRPVHPGRDRHRAQAARRTGARRLDPVLGDAGGPRVDGLGGRAQAAAGRRRAEPRARHRGAHRRAGARPAGAADARPRDRGGRRRRCAAERHGPRPGPPPRPGDRRGPHVRHHRRGRWPPPSPSPEPFAS